MMSQCDLRRPAPLIRISAFSIRVAGFTPVSSYCILYHILEDILNSQLKKVLSKSQPLGCITEMHKRTQDLRLLKDNEHLEDLVQYHKESS